MKWDFSDIFTSSGCGNEQVATSAVSKDGGEFALRVDGKEVKVKTIQIAYESTLSSGRCGHRKIVNLRLFSPHLNDMVFFQHMQYDKNGFLVYGWEQTFKAIRTVSGATKTSEAPK